jgi:DNA-binding transcriptional ArsR family regulator
MSTATIDVVARAQKAQTAEKAEKELITLGDAASMKAIAHPARYRVIEELYNGRELTATQAAELCGLTPSAMSYHLRTLERYGLITAGESADGRERPWRKAGDDITFANTEGVIGPATAQAILGNVLASVERLLRRTPASGTPWGLTARQGSLRLTDEQATELDRRVGSVLDEFEAAEPSAGPDAPPTREYFWIRGTRAD